MAGNRRLSECTGAIGRSEPAWLFVTGDVADHGGEDEWKIAVEQLQSIKAVSDSVRIIGVVRGLRLIYGTGEAVMLKLAPIIM